MIALGTGVPLALALAMTALRPELLGAMTRHWDGWLLIGLEVLMWLAGTGFYLVASLRDFRSGAPRIALSVAGFALCTLRALLVLLFGPAFFRSWHGSPGV